MNEVLGENTEKCIITRHEFSHYKDNIAEYVEVHLTVKEAWDAQQAYLIVTEGPFLKQKVMKFQQAVIFPA